MPKLHGPIIVSMLVGFSAPFSQAAGVADPTQRVEHFDDDPHWEAHNNRVIPTTYPTIIQDFGFSETNHAGAAAGEMGGRIHRASEPAFYAAAIAPKTLDDKLSASGTFALTKTNPGGAIFFGFFRAEQPGAGGRPTGSIGLHLGCERTGGRLAVRLITGKNQSCGTFITPFLPGKFRPTVLRNDGTRYRWTLDYDPAAADGRGRFTFTLRSDAHQPGELETPDLLENFKEEARQHFPSTTTFSVELPEGYRAQPTTFDHFGMMNMMKPGGHMVVYFDDLKYLDQPQDFPHDPGWEASGNRTSYTASDVGGAHDFGYSETNHAAGAKAGEVGGTFWRAGEYAYYADTVGPFTLNDRLEARGKVILRVGGPDADMFLGFFNSADTERSPREAGHFVGVHVGGPTRVGHYFHPSFVTGKGTRAQSQSGPVLPPGRACNWSLLYDPIAADGRGAITVTLDDNSETLVLKHGLKAQGATLDRFGLFTSPIGGQMVKLFIDDVTYTATK